MENKEKNFMSAVIYVHNAEDRVAGFLKTIIQTMESNFEKSEIICVNDFSCDNSVDAIKAISKQAVHTNVSILNMSYFHGLEGAMTAGVDLSIGDFVLEFDSTIQDFEQDEIMKVYWKALEGYDIVSASPNRRQKLSSNLFYFIFDRFTDMSYKIYTENFRILSRRVINRIGSMNKTVLYRKAVYANCGLKTLNLRYNVVPNEANKYSDKKEMKYRRGLAIDTLILFTGVGYRFSVIMTFLMMLVAIFMAVYSLVVYTTSTSFII